MKEGCGNGQRGTLLLVACYVAFMDMIIRDSCMWNEYTSVLSHPRKKEREKREENNSNITTIQTIYIPTPTKNAQNANTHQRYPQHPPKYAGSPPQLHCGYHSAWWPAHTHIH